MSYLCPYCATTLDNRRTVTKHKCDINIESVDQTREHEFKLELINMCLTNKLHQLKYRMAY